MKAVIQRVEEATVSVDGEIVGSCRQGYMILFGADMKVSLINDGPVTILYDTDIWRKS